MKSRNFISCLLIMVLVGFSSFSYGQNVKNQNVSPEDPRINRQGDQGGPTGGTGYIADLYAKSVESFYVNKDFTPGKVILKNGDVLSDRTLRYNIYTQQMQFVKDGDTMAFGDPTEISRLEFLDKAFVHKAFMRVDQEVDVDYFEILYEGHVKLLLRRVVTHELKAKSIDTDPEEAYLVTKQYYLQRDNKPAVIIPLKKKAVLNLFADKDEQLKEFMKKEKLNCHKEMDLVRLVEYYDGLK
ncbi:MAG: hypothetical protein JEZ03_05640 [Bacteroidales bacterium]|nr:hypothetical protein [Bacteroidales bacterium]